MSMKQGGQQQYDGIAAPVEMAGRRPAFWCVLSGGSLPFGSLIRKLAGLLRQG
jgi:hypothetical protein